MTSAAAGSRWRLIASRENRHPLLPALLLGAVLAAVAAAALLLPGTIAGPAALIVAVAGLGLGYLLYPLPALLAFALLMLFSRTLARWLAPELAQLDELTVPLLVVLAAARTRPWRRRMFEPVRDGALLAVLALGVVSALVNGVPTTTWLLGLLLTGKVFAFLHVVLWHDVDGDAVRQLVPLVAGVASVVLVVGGIEALSPVAVRELLNLGDIGLGREGLPSIKSLLWHPSTFSWFSAVIGLMLVAGYTVLRRWWLLAGGIVFGAATILGARRRALAAAVVALAAGFASALGRGRLTAGAARAWAALGLAALVVGVVFLPSLVGLARSAFEDVGEADNARVALYGASLAIARDEFPLGVGFGRFASAPSKSPYSPVYAQYGLDRIRGLGPDRPIFVGDADWARVIGETGAGGLAAMLVFCAALALSTWRAARATYRDPVVAAFTLGAWMVLVQGLIETLASSMFDSPPRIYLLFGIVATAIALRRATDGAPATD